MDFLQFSCLWFLFVLQHTTNNIVFCDNHFYRSVETWVDSKLKIIEMLGKTLIQWKERLYSMPTFQSINRAIRLSFMIRSVGDLCSEFSFVKTLIRDFLAQNFCFRLISIYWKLAPSTSEIYFNKKSFDFKN